MKLANDRRSLTCFQCHHQRRLAGQLAHRDHRRLAQATRRADLLMLAIEQRAMPTRAALQAICSADRPSTRAFLLRFDDIDFDSLTPEEMHAALITALKK
jgi:hypothetical protein